MTLSGLQDAGNWLPHESASAGEYLECDVVQLLFLSSPQSLDQRVQETGKGTHSAGPPLSGGER